MAFANAENPATLEPGETAVVLGETGQLIAVSVSTMWQSNNGGVVICGKARALTDKGFPVLCGHGQPVMTEFPYSADAGVVGVYGAATLAREVLLLVLGEPLTIIDKPGGEDGQPITEPIIKWGDDVRLNASIRHALSCVADTSAASDPDAILFGANKQ